METEASGAAEAQSGQEKTSPRAIDKAKLLERWSHLTLALSSLLLGPANGQLNSGYVYNWTSWLDDYGFGKCPDVKKCNVYPDGRPFPQSNDWRRRSYVYVWHAMGGDISLFVLVLHQISFLSLRFITLHHVVSYLNVANHNVQYRTGV